MQLWQRFCSTKALSVSHCIQRLQSPFQTIYEENDAGEARVEFEYTKLRTNPTYIVTYVMWYR